jgi:hypothetical protein
MLGMGVSATMQRAPQSNARASGGIGNVAGNVAARKIPMLALGGHAPRQHQNHVAAAALVLGQRALFS